MRRRYRGHPRGDRASLEPPSGDDLHTLLYCAGVFVQTDDVAFRRMAQSIALNALLIDDKPRRDDA